MRKIYALFLLMAPGLPAAADNWMSRLPDPLYVAQVSIPGSHDAATAHGWSGFIGGFAGNSTSKTQDLTLSEQWALGVRAFDLRPKVEGSHLHCYHGVAKIDLRFDDALCLLRDSLAKNPSEFVVIHLLYADGFSDDKDTYKTQLLELLQGEGLKDYVVDFRRDLTVADMRGKMLLLSRDAYDTKPVGGFLQNWCGWIDWAAQTSGTVRGAGTGTMASSPLYMQDLSDTHEDGMVDEKVKAVQTMLNFSTKQTVESTSDLVWIFNFASGYSKVTKLLDNNVSSSDGYRDNATYTNRAIVDYLKTHEAGPTGIILADYVGVDESKAYSGSTVYATAGKELVDSVIANNYKYLDRINQAVYDKNLKQVDRLYSRMESYRAEIAESCPDVAADFDDDWDAAKAGIDSIKLEMDSLRAGWLLTESYEIGYTTQFRKLYKIVEAAKAAQALYDETSAVRRLETDAEQGRYKVYSPSGELLPAPRRGEVNILHYDDGTVRKVVF